MDFAGYTIRRADLDNIFFQAALQHKNIEIVQNFQVQGLLKNEAGAAAGVEGTLAGESAKRSHRARVVVGADGAASAVSRLLGLPASPVEHVYSAVRGYWRGVEGMADSIELFFIDGVLPGYLWIFPMGEGMANVGLGILSSDLAKGRKHPATVLSDAVANHPAICRRFSGASLEGRISGWAIPNGSFRKQCHGDGWALVGDAASLVDPFSGEGMGNALMSGKFAAMAISKALSENKNAFPISAASLKNYSDAVDAQLRPEMENSYKLQRLSRFRFLLNLFIGKAATKPEARQMVIGMLASDEEKKKVESPLFYLKMLLP
jgi:flavin-dependent dehydrogenase